jgi:hypothetical protein
MRLLSSLSWKDINEKGGYRPSKKFKYRYPGSGDLSPGSDKHNKIVNMVLTYSYLSHKKMNVQFDTWRELDRYHRGYITPEDDLAIRDIRDSKKDKSSSKIIHVKMPMLHYIQDTYMMYFAAEFLRYPFYVYKGVRSEDDFYAYLYTELVKRDSINGKLLVQFNYFLKNIVKYGFGAVYIDWLREEDSLVYGRPTRNNSRMNIINPFNFLPDPTHGLVNTEEGRFVGYISRSSYPDLLMQENMNRDIYFNTKYLKEFGNNLPIYSNTLGQYQKPYNYPDFISEEHYNLYEEIKMFIKVIPKEYGLGPSTEPEWWFFVVTGSGVLRAAIKYDRVGAHLPIFTSAPDAEYGDLYPMSRLNMAMSLQQVADYLVNSHINNLRKAVNGETIINPKTIRMQDVLTERPDKIVRTRDNFFSGKISDQYYRVPVSNVTQGNMFDLNNLIGTGGNFLGVGSGLSGNLRSNSAEISAAEAQGVFSVSQNKLGRLTGSIFQEMIKPAGEFVAELVKNNMLDGTYIRISNAWQQQLRGVGIYEQSYAVRRADLDIDLALDVSQDFTALKTNDVAAWQTALNTASTNPEIYKEYNISRLYAEMLRRMGIQNVEDMRRVELKAEVVGGESLDQQIQQGNAVPIGGGNG